MENDGDMADSPRLDLLRVVFDSVIREAVAILDETALVVGWNEAIGRLTGCPHDRVEGLHVSSFWPGWGEVSASIGRPVSILASWQFEEAQSLVVNVTVEPISGGPDGPVGCALIVRQPGPNEGEIEGDLRQGNVSASPADEDPSENGRSTLRRWTNPPLPDSKGRRVGVLSIAEDEADRMAVDVALRIGERLFRAVFEGSLEALLLADDQGRFLGVNSAAEEVFGVEPGGLIGRVFGDIFETRPDFEAEWSRFLETGSTRAPGSSSGRTGVRERSNATPGQT